MATNGFDSASTAANQQVNALYLGLFDRPADPTGQAYWANQAGTGSALPSTSVDTIGSYATYNGAKITNANINHEIVSIYANLFGDTVSTTNSGVAYWAAQFNAGQSIGQIVSSIYNDVEHIHAGSGNYVYTETMNAKLGLASAITQNYVATNSTPTSNAGYASATNLLNNGYTTANYSSLPASPSTIAQSETYSGFNSHTFIGSIGNDTITLNGPPSAGTVYSITGGTGANTIDVNYGASASELTTYLGSASSFQTLDFTGSSEVTGPVDLSKIDNGGFTNINLYLSNGFADTITFQNATSADIFTVGANSYYGTLTISDATGQTATTVDLGTATTAGVTLGTLDTYVATSAATSTAIALPNTVNPTTVDIVSNGTAANTISTLDVANNSTVNITGSDNLTISSIIGTGITYNTSAFTGKSLMINGVQDASATTAIALTPGSKTTIDNNHNYAFTIANDTGDTRILSSSTATPPTTGNGNISVTATGTSLNSTSTTPTVTDGGDKIVLGNGNDSINIITGTGITNTISYGITLGNGNDSVTSAGTGNDSITLGGTGATGNDTVTMTGTKGITPPSSAGFNDTISIHSSGTDSVSIAGNGDNNISITGTGTDSITVGNGDNNISITGTGTDSITVGNGDNTIVAGNGTDSISIGQGANIITLGSGHDSINLTTIYGTTSGGITTAGAAYANTLYNSGTTSGTSYFSGTSSDTLVFNHSADVTPTAAGDLLTKTLGSEHTTAGTSTSSLTSAQVAINTEISSLQTNDTAAGDTSVGWLNNGGTSDTWIVMDHNTGNGFVDQVMQIVGGASYLSSSSVVSINHAGLVSVAL
jgi:hypothetical protein